jgi:hypothetical protein
MFNLSITNLRLQGSQNQVMSLHQCLIQPAFSFVRNLADPDECQPCVKPRTPASHFLATTDPQLDKSDSDLMIFRFSKGAAFDARSFCADARSSNRPDIFLSPVPGKALLALPAHQTLIRPTTTIMPLTNGAK